MRAGWRSVGMLLGLLLAGMAFVQPVSAKERDPLTPRVPAGKLEDARALKNPLPPSPSSIARGEAVYRGVGSCNVCHGESGKGDGIGASGLDPSPRDFSNARWHKARSDGELMWVLRHGSPGTAMITVVPGLISEADGWNVINYLRSLAK